MTEIKDNNTLPKSENKTSRLPLDGGLQYRHTHINPAPNVIG